MPSPTWNKISRHPYFQIIQLHWITHPVFCIHLFFFVSWVQLLAWLFMAVGLKVLPHQAHFSSTWFGLIGGLIPGRMNQWLFLVPVKWEPETTIELRETNMVNKPLLRPAILSGGTLGGGPGWLAMMIQDGSTFPEVSKTLEKKTWRHVVCNTRVYPPKERIDV